ncbi:hypothetical protein NHH82_12010 [Oxalobacteraceae bacterium OTU3REALA1]|nr:hypothetical protein NHH82_12010 [Oxalobacteraceae bacterium OTU3REALA1]
MAAPQVEDKRMNANSEKDYIDAKSDSIRAGMDGRLGAFEANVNGKFATLDATIAQVRTEIKESAERVTSQMVKWMVGIFIATLTIFFSSMMFLLNTAIPKLQAQPVQTVQPIVIQLPPMPAAPARP